MSPAKYACLFEIGVIAGCIVSLAGIELPHPALLISLAVFGIILRKPLIVICIAAGFVLAQCRVEVSETALQPDSLATSYAGQQITAEGIVMEVQHRIDRQQLVVKISHPAKGRSLVTMRLYPHISAGDVIRYSCTVRRPEPIEDFAYDAYLANKGIFSICKASNVEVIGANRHASLGALFGRWRGGLATVIEDRFAEPYAAMLTGILIGSREAIPEEMIDAFRVSGVSHLIALSGFNITIIITMFFAVLRHSGINRRRSFGIVCVAVMAFVIFTGMSASVLRAGVMGIFALMGRHLGRSGNIWYIIIASASLMGLLDPGMFADIGFQLSFVATIGLLLLSKPMSLLFSWLPDAFGLKEVIATTTAATLATAPLVSTQFQTVSLAGLVVNLLVLPVIPMVMLFGAIACLPFISTIPVLLTSAGLAWVMACAEWYAKVPWSSVALSLPLWSTLAFYGTLCIVILWTIFKPLRKPFRTEAAALQSS